MLQEFAIVWSCICVTAHIDTYLVIREKSEIFAAYIKLSACEWVSWLMINYLV